MPMLPIGIQYLINENPKEYQLRSLEAFGINGAKLIQQPQAMFSKCERLWFATPLGHTGLTSGAVLRKVADKILKKTGDANPDANRNGIYISRKFAANRRVLNEDSLLPLFNNFKVEIFYSEKHSFEEQVKKFHDSRCIIGPHGAGLTNAMFCKSGSLVVELATENMGIHYMTSSLGMGMDYQKVLCLPVVGHDFNSDIYVNPVDVEKCLSRYFGRNEMKIRILP
jgi:capsular polysaccharide biosynthesis protein